MRNDFRRALRRQRYVRLAILGTKGSGKTRAALTVAGTLGRRVAVIDSDRGASELAVGEPGVPAFDVHVVESHDPRSYVRALRDAERAGYDVIVLDTGSSAWSGRGGAVNLADRSQRGWREAGPLLTQLIDTMLSVRAHLVVTLRLKVEHALEVVDGRAEVRRHGLAPVQQAGFADEFDLVTELDADHALRIVSTRAAAFDRMAPVERDDLEVFGGMLLSWSLEGASRPEPKRDRFGLVVPRCPVPKVAAGKPKAGRLWTELSFDDIETLALSWAKLSPDQRDWVDYLLRYHEAGERWARERVVNADAQPPEEVSGSGNGAAA